jgi:Protein of unknown function (DUF2946)
MRATFLTSRARRWCVQALLPLLLLRALVPVGFMPAIGTASLGLVFCEPQAHAGHHHHAGAEGSHPGGHAKYADCPYAQSASPALLADVHEPVLAPAIVAIASTACDHLAPRAPPPRHRAPRGPPILS